MTDTMTVQPGREDRLIAWLAALAICIHIVESALPSPLPGMKPGLANVITIAVLIRYGWVTAAWVSLLRVLVGSLLIGTFLTPTFVLSLSGALASLLALRLFTALPGLGPVGYCLIAALAHMGGQFFSAYVLFIPHPGLFTLLPLFMTLALTFGIMSGIIVVNMLRQLPPALTE